MENRGGFALTQAFDRAEAQVARLRASGWKLSRNDIGVVVMAQIVAEISRRVGKQFTEEIFVQAQDSIAQAINRLESFG